MPRQRRDRRGAARIAVDRIAAAVCVSAPQSVLSAADRMHLMPFAQLSTRLGGVVTLLLTSLLVPIL